MAALLNRWRRACRAVLPGRRGTVEQSSKEKDVGRRHARIAALLLAFAGGAAGAAAPPNQDPQLLQSLQAIDAATTAKDCKKVVTLGEALIVARHGKLPPRIEGSVEWAVAGCAVDLGAKDKGYAHALAGTRIEDSPDELWQMRLWMEMEAKKYAAAVATVEAMTQGRGAALNDTPMQWLYRLNVELKEAGLKQERMRLLKLLAADAYAPSESAGDAQGLHYTYAVLLAGEGDAAGARTLLASITDAGLLVEAMFEPKLAPLLPPKLDIRAAAEAGLAHDRAIADRHSDQLDPIHNVAVDLRLLGRPQEALALLQPIVAATANAGAPAYTDAARGLPWIWDEIGRSNEALGRYEEAVKAFSAGAALGEEGGGNVSQVINLAHMQVRFGHADDALKTVARLDGLEGKATPHGLMEMHLARGCANAKAGHAQAAAADLAYAEAHRKDGEAVVGDLNLCLGRMDQAAASFIRRLDDPDERAEALRDLSDYDPPPAPIPAAYGGGIEALKARTDVKAAIAKAGGTRRIPLQPSGL
jgi:tetratricopeptide (TPR) repeat protein